GMEKRVVQGQKSEAGMGLYRKADLGLVWVQAQIYEQDLPFVQLGQEAEVSLSYLPDRKFRGRVTYIYPTVDAMTRTARVRMEFHNPGYLLKPGMFATVQVRAELDKDALLVPDSAVLRSGEKNTVFVALDGGKFEPRTVTLGPRGEGDVYQVFSGLDEGDRVVTSGQFMLDSESQLREAIQKMLDPQLLPPATSPSVASTPSGPAAPAADTKHRYLCPMPEHVSIQYDHPGNCPLCGMSLVPVTPATLDKIQPGGKVLHYACPMTDDCPTPGHGENKFDKPGKCPVCGMTLIPVMETPKADAAQTAPLPTLYTCPMASHAHIVTDEPGLCPECEMTLVETSSVKHRKQAEDNWRKQNATAHQH
ncbi:MAG TPA: efflux RND transporter periplasmic adaptor subunit, partial [Verrucomicrobiota bacterium]|nr:efflux RND transporter periplasmic adaptor subunit [Verrucomicrobiota bacterium]